MIRHTPLMALGMVGALLTACNTDPREDTENTDGLGQVEYRTGDEDLVNAPGSMSGERGNVKIAEVLWSGSVTNDGVWDKSDVFIELRNESNRPLNMTGWYIILEGGIDQTWRIPAHEGRIDVGQQLLIAAKNTGCFPNADVVIEGLRFSYGDPLRLTLRDADERLMEPVGSRTQPPFGGGYDYVDSRSMERINLMFGGYGTEPHVWHYYTDAPVDVPNNDLIDENCRRHTLASPGRPNSPDYSGAYASGSFE